VDRLGILHASTSENRYMYIYTRSHLSHLVHVAGEKEEEEEHKNLSHCPIAGRKYNGGILDHARRDGGMLHCQLDWDQAHLKACRCESTNLFNRTRREEDRYSMNSSTPSTAQDTRKKTTKKEGGYEYYDH
jgi:hypothetical protein